jgi:hypothetical protein
MTATRPGRLLRPTAMQARMLREAYIIIILFPIGTPTGTPTGTATGGGGTGADAQQLALFKKLITLGQVSIFILTLIKAYKDSQVNETCGIFVKTTFFLTRMDVLSQGKDHLSKMQRGTIHQYKD